MRYGSERRCRRLNGGLCADRKESTHKRAHARSHVPEHTHGSRYMQHRRTYIIQGNVNSRTEIYKHTHTHTQTHKHTHTHTHTHTLHTHTHHLL